MPHVIVKLYPGRSEELKKRLAQAITQDVVDIIQCDEKFVSIAFEEIDPDQWPERVYKPDILVKRQHLYKEPGYNPFE